MGWSIRRGQGCPGQSQMLPYIAGKDRQANNTALDTRCLGTEIESYQMTVDWHSRPWSQSRTKEAGAHGRTVRAQRTPWQSRSDTRGQTLHGQLELARPSIHSRHLPRYLDTDKVLHRTVSTYLGYR